MTTKRKTCKRCNGRGTITVKLDNLPPNIIKQAALPGHALPAVVDWPCLDCTEPPTLTLT